MNREELLKKEILNQYKSLRQFAQEIGIAPSTLTTILNNGIGGTSIDTVLTICEKLNLDINLFHEGVQKDQEMVSESEISYIKKIRALNKKSQDFILGMIDDLYEQRELMFQEPSNDLKQVK